VDPVSGKKVDKATAVVGVEKAGNVYFFESVENLERFRVPAKGAK
jgi:YHS domain-containing protein